MSPDFVLGLGLLLFFVPAVLGTLWACFRICGKAGYPAWYALLVVIPVVNLIALLYFAVAEWPVERKLRQLQEQQKGTQ